MDNWITEGIFVLLIIFGEMLLRRFSNQYYKKYQIRERKLVPLLMILLFLGLLLPVLGFSFMIMQYQDETLTLQSFGCFGSAMMIGVGLLILMVIIIVRKDEIYPVDPASLQKDRVAVTAIKRVRTNVGKRRKTWGWIFSIGGFLILAACIFLFFAYGPINEPFISPEHEENDRLINYCCASVTLIGIILFGLGISMMRQREKLPPG